MATNSHPLTKKQREVLQWVRNGCPTEVFTEGYEHRITARALERRGLILITGRGPIWSAEVTEEGRAWECAPLEKALRVEDQAELLINQVLEAGGRLALPDGAEARENYERLVRTSLKSPSRPRGKRLQIISTGTWGTGSKALVFSEYFDDYVQTRPVPIPERVARYHPAVKAFMADKRWPYVTSEHRPRAGRILQALAAEASIRHIDVLNPEDAAKEMAGRPRQHIRTGNLALRAPGGTYAIEIKESSGPDTSIRSGRFELIVRGPGSAYDGDRYRDTKTISVEDRLPQVFRSLEIYKLRADWHEQQRQREQAERRRQWEAAMVSAKERYFEHARWEHFTELSRTWASLNQHRAFLHAAKEAVQACQSENQDAVLQQLDHAQRTIETLDPIHQLSKIVPEVPDPQPEDLKPFLGRWSPHGPDGLHW